MQLSDIKLSHKVLILVSVPIFFMVIFVGTLSYLKKQAEDEIWRERHAKAVTAECNSLMRNFMDTGLYLFLFQKTHRQDFFQRYKTLSIQIPAQIDSLKIMLRDSPHQEAALQQLDRAGDDVVALLRDADEMISRDIQGVKDLSGTSHYLQASTEMLSCLRKFISEQQEVERTNPQKEAKLRHLTDQWLGGGLILSIVLAILLALFFNRATTNRLLVLVDNTLKLGSGKQLNAPLVGKDEIAYLDKIFHDMADALADASRRKQELVQMVTHDLRTPLTSIDASLKIIGSGIVGQLSEKASRQISIAKRSTERLLNLINDLLDIERLETGNFPLDRKSVSTRLVIESAVESVKALANEKGIPVIGDEVDLTVLADPARIEQVLINLISNAIKFSPDGASVEVKAADLGKQVEFKVIDHGRGVPPEYQTVIFERFGQVKQEDSKRGKGTGLGLPICKALVLAHDGEIGLLSQDGQGSTFWFRLPKTGC